MINTLKATDLSKLTGKASMKALHALYDFHYTDIGGLEQYIQIIAGGTQY